jgi:hypothetical protein
MKWTGNCLIWCSIRRIPDDQGCSWATSNALRPDSTLLFLMIGMRRTPAGLAAVQALRIAVLNQSYEDFWAYRQGLIV